MTKTGHLPIYVDNGFKCYSMTMFAFVVLSGVLYLCGMRPTMVYDKFDEILSTLNIFSLVLVLLLYFKVGVAGDTRTALLTIARFYFRAFISQARRTAARREISSSTIIGARSCTHASAAWT